MRNYLLAAVAAAAITATPAFARDGSGYIGVEGGVIFGAEMEMDLDYDGDVFDDGADVEFQTGLDTDMIAGYDFGMFRAEAELGYKRMKIDSIDYTDAFADAFFDEGDDEVEFEGKANVLSLMGNLLVDFGNDDGISFYAGGGFGRARVKALDDRDSAWAWQGIVGARAAALPQVDVGLKYRYFQTGKLDFDDDVVGLGSQGKLRSHSILASLIYNFAAPAVPPPPPPPPPPEPAPPPPPETVTCPDGSVIPATSECPLPPPPPPPEPAPERG